jgi:hypothetical protein
MGKFVITEEEKKRILNMHQSTKMKPFLFEMEIKKGTTLSNGKTILNWKSMKSGNPLSTVVFLQTSEDGTGQNFACGRHEREIKKEKEGKPANYYLDPIGPNKENMITKEESQALYNMFCAGSKPTVA